MLTTLEEDFRKLGLDPALVLGESCSEEEQGNKDISEMDKSYDEGYGFEEDEDYGWVENPDYIKSYKSAADAVANADDESLGQSWGMLNKNHKNALGDRWAKTHGRNSWGRTYESINRMACVRESVQEKYEMSEDQQALAQELASLYAPAELRAFAVKHNLEIDPDAHDAYQMKYSLRKAIKGMGESGVVESKDGLNESEESLEEGLVKKKLKKMKASEKGKARRLYRKNKAKIKRKLKKLKAKPKYKRKKEKLKRLKKGRDAGARKKFVIEGIEHFTQTNLFEGTENLLESFEVFQALLQEANELAQMKEFVRVGETLKPMDVELNEEPIEKHVGDTLNSPDKEGDTLEKAGVADKYSHKHIGESEDSHVYFYNEMDKDTAVKAVEMAGMKPKKTGDDVLIFSNEEDADKAKEIFREKQIYMDEDRELVRLFQNAVYSESFDLKIGNLMEDTAEVMQRFRKGAMSQADASAVLKHMQSFLAGTMKGLSDAISDFKGKYLGQDDVEEDGTAPDKAENHPHVGEKIDATPGKPVDPEKNIKHIGDKIDEKTEKPVKPESNIKHQEPKTKDLNKGESPVKADNVSHIGDMPYGEKGTEVPVQSGIKTESEEAPKANLEESKKDLMDLAKENADNREDWVMATVSSGIFYAMGRAPGEMYKELVDSPELFYTANEKIRSGELKANPCDIADWLKDQARDKGIEGDFQEPLEIPTPTDGVPPVGSGDSEPEPEVQDEKKK